MTDAPKPPAPLTYAEASRLVEWLNWMAGEWPRIVATMALHRTEFASSELSGRDSEWGPDAERRPKPGHYMPQPGLHQTDLAGLLSAMVYNKGYSMWEHFEARMSPAGTVEFILHMRKPEDL